MKYTLRAANEDWLRRLLNPLIPFDRFYLTYRLPGKLAVITYPPGQPPDPGTIEHEEFHVRQLQPWYGPVWVGLLAVLFPLPVVFSGRWFIERYAYLNCIQAGRRTVEEVVAILWRHYLFAWPPDLMRKWFHKQLRASHD